MAGYNGRTAQSNATAVNSQIIKQRKSVNVTNGTSLAPEDLDAGTVSGMGISRNQSLNMFTDFNGQQIMNDSYAVFLANVDASSNPDFPVEFDPDLFRSHNRIIELANLEREDEAVDNPTLGLGPNLKAQNIDNVISGDIQRVDNVSPDLPGGRGFGITDPNDAGLTMGSYFKNRYSVSSDPAAPEPPREAVKGERASAPEDPYDYNQD